MISTNKTINQALFDSFIDSVKSDAVLQRLWHETLKDGALDTSANFGSGDVRSKLKSSVLAADSSNDGTGLSPKLGVHLTDIYQDKKKKTNLLLTVCIVSIGLAFLLLLIALVIAFNQNQSSDVSFITTAVSLVPTFLSGTFFLFYKRANKDLQVIENDIKKLRVLEGLRDIADMAPDPELIKVAYEKIIKQMNL